MKRAWRLLMAAGLVPLFSVGVTLADDAVVNAPCLEADFDAALAIALQNGGGTITFNCGAPTTIGFSSEKTITTGNTVIIDGADLITIDGNDTTRLFRVQNGATLEVRNIILTNGNGEGGAILNENGGTVTIVNGVISSNQSNGGNAGALLNNGGGSVMTIIDSELFDNYTSSDGGVIDTNSGSTLTIQRSTFRNNESDDDGGAIELDGGTVTIEDSTFDNNKADPNGGDGGAIDVDGGTLTITRSTFSNNSGNDGGAIENEDGTVTIDTSTFSGNNADDDGGAIYDDDFGGSTTIANTTITDNTADGSGGGLDQNGDPLSLNNTIVAGNSPQDCSGDITSNDFNLDSDDTCDLVQANDIPAGNADLGPLANHGGPTLTHMPNANSDAIDNGPLSCISPDQRGQTRPFGPACDIGSVERRTGATFALCVVWATGRVVSPLSGQCGAGQFELDVPEIYPTTFCVDGQTGQLYWFNTQKCTYPKFPVMMPANGDLLTCVDTRSTMNRRVSDHSQCFAWELPNTIPATP